MKVVYNIKNNKRKSGGGVGRYLNPHQVIKKNKDKE